MVGGEQRAVRVQLQWSGGQTTNHLYTTVGERYLELVGPGELEIFDEIIGTLRFFSPGS